MAGSRNSPRVKHWSRLAQKAMRSQSKRLDLSLKAEILLLSQNLMASPGSRTLWEESKTLPSSLPHLVFPEVSLFQCWDVGRSSYDRRVHKKIQTQITPMLLIPERLKKALSSVYSKHDALESRSNKTSEKKLPLKTQPWAPSHVRSFLFSHPLTCFFKLHQVRRCSYTQIWE